MAEVAYIDKKFSSGSQEIIAHARAICEAYRTQGYDLTLRQLYYQFVSRDLIANKDTEYKRLGSVINDARLAGELDWEYIVDRTRNLRSLAHWDTPSDVIEAAARGFRMPKWDRQPYHVEVWIEKDALVGVLEQACQPLDVPYFSCRGYTSQSEMWYAAQRLGGALQEGKKVRIIHLGDHDPSGIDMTRDIEERLAMFMAQDIGISDMKEIGRNADEIDYGWELNYYGPSAIGEAAGVEFVNDDENLFEVDRIALTMAQIRQYDPPPNPAKLSDARAADYIINYGSSSWELDALEPTALAALITNAVLRYRDDELWEEAAAEEADERIVLTAASQRWSEVKEMLS
jgi:hypothetical protein